MAQNPVPVSLARILEHGEDLLQGAEELLAIHELGSAALKAYKLVRRRRLVSFLKTLDYEIGKHGAEAKDRLKELLESKDGAEILADFAESAVRSSSRIVGAALAVLYTDTERTTYPPNFTAFACNALEGLSDASIEFFLAVTEVVPFDLAPGEQPGFEVCHLDNLLQRKPEILALAPTMAEQVTLINELQDRGMLLREHASRFGGAGGSGITYGVSVSTKGLRHLLLRAKSLLPNIDA
jgi:hypothetical protein